MAGQAAFASLFALPEEEAAHIPQEDPVAEDCEVKRCKLTNLGGLDLAEEMEMKDGKEETPKPSTSMWAALEQQCARKAPVQVALENTNAPLALEDIQAQGPLAIEDIPKHQAAAGDSNDEKKKPIRQATPQNGQMRVGVNKNAFGAEKPNQQAAREDKPNEQTAASQPSNEQTAAPQACRGVKRNHPETAATAASEGIPTVNLTTTTFARRKCPKTTSGNLKWTVLRSCFHNVIRERLSTSQFSLHEDAWWSFASSWFEKHQKEITYQDACCAAAEYLRKHSTRAAGTGKK